MMTGAHDRRRFGVVVTPFSRQSKCNNCNNNNNNDNDNDNDSDSDNDNDGDNDNDLFKQNKN